MEPETSRPPQTIRALRRERGWTQFDLALRVGVRPQTVYLWETGRRIPQVPQLRRLGQVFGLCSDDIVLEPVEGSVDGDRRRPRAGRDGAGVVPGRDAEGRAVVRGQNSRVVRPDDV
jgi:DNA-binding XRE family transcriptional regulator